jgi:predicted nucleic acid-binding protein
MDFSSSLTDTQLPLVLDASAMISLHKCSFGAQMLSAIPNKILVPKLVADEFERGEGGSVLLARLSEGALIEVTQMSNEEDEIFEKLITSLDDGEASTIAIAINRHGLPIIDEKKGRARAQLLEPSLTPGWSLDLFRHAAVISQLGEENAIEALHRSLRLSRMRIPCEKLEEVISVIGESRARQCTCLPNYRERFGPVRSVTN